MNQTALFDWHVAHGGRMVDFAGWQMPIQYTSIIDEHQAVRQRAGLFDIAHMGRLVFEGAGACGLLDHLLTNNVRGLAVGQVRYSLICNEQGGILDDVLVYRFADSYLLVVNASNREKIVGWIAQQASGYDAGVSDQTLQTFMLALQGPRAQDLLQPLVRVKLSTLKYYSAVETDLGDIPCRLSRTGYTGEDGFEVIVPASEGPPLWKSLIESHRADGLSACGLGCRDTLRLEAGMPLYGHEMDESTDPFTAGLAFGVKMQAGAFVGRPALMALREQPPLRRRVGLVLEGRRIARQGAAVLSAQNHAIGEVTSGTFSPTLERSIAMASIDAALGDDQPLSVDIRGQQVPARLTPLPFYTRGG